MPLPTVYERALQRIAIMDKTGYDARGWPSTTLRIIVSVPRCISWACTWPARRSISRIGTGISLAAFYHPLRLAEEVALLDVLSGGRVNWGWLRVRPYGVQGVRRAAAGKPGALP